MTGFYWECGLFPILMNDTSKCFRKKDLREIEYPAGSSSELHEGSSRSCLNCFSRERNSF